MKPFIYIILFFSVFTSSLLAQDPITTYTVTKNNGNCLSNSSITISFPSPSSGSYQANWTAELSIAGSAAQPQTISIPSNGNDITFSNLITNNYVLKLTNGFSTLTYSGNPIVITSSYTSMSVNASSIAPTCANTNTYYTDNGKITITISAGGVGPFQYTATSPANGTQTAQSSNRSYTFNNMKGGEDVSYSVQDLGCNATLSGTHRIVSNSSNPLTYAFRAYNFIRECPDCSAITMFVNIDATTANIGTRLNTIKAAGNATITINGISYNLTYVGTLTGGHHRFKYDPIATGGPFLTNGMSVTTAFNWGCDVLSNTTTVTMNNTYLNVFSTPIVDNTTCSVSYKITMIGDQDASGSQRNVYFCPTNTLIVEKQDPANLSNYSTVYTGSLNIASISTQADPAASAAYYTSSPGTYRITASDGCHTVTKSLTITSSAPVSQISALPTASILEGTLGFNLTGTGLNTIKYPLNVKVERVDGQTSMNISPTQPYNLAGSYTINFPFTYTFNTNPGAYANIIDLPPGNYKITLTDACTATSGISQTLTVNLNGGASYSPSTTVNSGCLNSNSVTYALNKNNFTFNPDFVEFRNRNQDGSEGTLISSVTNNTTSSGTFNNLASGLFYLKFTNVSGGYSAARNISGPFSYRKEIDIATYQNIDIDISTQFCDVNNPNSGIISAQVTSGTLKYPLTMSLYSQSNPSTPIQGPISITSPNTSNIFTGVPVGSYFIRTTSLCYTFDKNFSIQTTSTPPVAQVSEAIVCPNSPSTAAAISATNNLYDITWYVKNTTTVVGTGMPVTLTPSTTTTYTAKFQLKPSFGCTNVTVYESDIQVNVTANPDLSTPQVSDIELCKNTTPFINLTNTENGFTYEVLNANGLSFSPKATGTGNGGTISINIPTPLTAGSSLKVISTNGNAGCKGELTDKVQIIQSTPLLSLTVEGSSICNGNSGTITIKNTEIGITYTVLKNGQPLSPSITGVGTGADQVFTIPAASLPAASNTFTIQASGTGCAVGTLTQTAVITTQQPPTSSTISPANCNGGKGSVTMNTFGGSGQYQYKIDNNAWGTNNSFTNLNPGSYIIYAKDNSLGCITQSTIQIVEDCFEITKTSTTSPNTYSAVGDILTYSIVVKNTGNTTMTNIQVSDPKANVSSSTIASLAPGASSTITATYTVTQADLDAGSFVNTASATFGTLTKSDNETISATLTPKLTLSKTPSTYTYSAAGNLITYTFIVLNSGNTTLTNISISDPLVGLSTISPANVSTLAPGATATFTATYSITNNDVLNGSLTNTATANGSFNNIAYNATSSVTITNTTPLPATGLELKGKWINEQQAELTWTTLTELNTDYFILEKSTDGFHFKEINVKIPAAENSLSKRYYVDYDRNISTNQHTYFYRVKVIDLDKSIRYSNIIVLKNNNSGSIKIYPNPVQNLINIEFYQTGNYDLSLFGYNGQLIKKIENLQIENGNKKFSLDRGSILEGNYMLRIYNKKNGEILHTKLIFLKQ